MLKKEEPSVALPTKFPVLAGTSIGPSFGIFVMGATVNSGEGMGKTKFEYIEQYPHIFRGKIEIFRGQRDWLNSTFDSMVAGM